MKPYIVILLLFFPLGSFTQNYQNICSPGITYFKNCSGYLGAFRRDSVYIPGVGDTIFISYTALRDPPLYYQCVDISNGSVMGRKVYKRHDGWVFFFNKDGDSVKINTQAALNQSWKLIEWTNLYIEATVTSINTDSILGQPDQVKVISLQAKDSHNLNVTSPFNQKQFRLSQHFGLSMLCDIYLIPSDTCTYTLNGKSTPQLGIQDLTWPKVYDYDVGDVFSFYFYQESNYYGSWFMWREHWTIETILSKTVYGNNDSIRYEREKCVKTKTFNGSGWDITYSTDTLVEMINLVQLLSNLELSFQPSELLDNHSTTYRFNGFVKYNQRPAKYLKYHAYQWYPPCYYETSDYSWPIKLRTYAEGLGLVDVYDKGETALTGTYLIYFKKGSETWGTPVASDCQTLVEVKYLPAGEPMAISIEPEPVEEQSWVRIVGPVSDKHGYGVLVNSMGRQVLKLTFNSSKFLLSRNGLPSGMYFLILYADDGTIPGGVKVMMK